MGWKMPDIWAERTTYGGQELIALHNCFVVNHWKAFLIGHQKYGAKPAWEPIEPLRGLPDDVSDTVEREFSSFMGIKEDRQCAGIENDAVDGVDVTYYSLAELQDIDLDVPFGIPDPKDVREGEDSYRNGIDYHVEINGEELYPSHHYIDPDLMDAAINGDSPVEIPLYADGGRYYTKAAYVYERADGELESPSDLPREQTGLLYADVYTRAVKARGWEELVSVLSEFGDGPESTRIVLRSGYPRA